MELFDVTIRDGSYYVDFKFSSDDISEIVKRIDKLGFKYIEIGHGQGLNASSPVNGLSMQSDIEYMHTALKSRQTAKLGFFFIPGIGREEDLKTAANNKMDFIRIGENADDIENSKDYIIKAKELGLEVMVNFMKSYLIPPSDFAHKAKMVKEWGGDCVYIVDSSGGMLPEQLEQYYYEIRNNTDIKIGFHGHNNLGLAVSNSLLAEQLGFDFIDTSMQGIGRSCGNAMAESLIMTMEKKGISTGFDIPQLLEYGFYINRYIIQRPAINPLDLICGYTDFHSSNLKEIYRCSMEMKVDPLRLIMEYAKKDKKKVDYKELLAVAKTLPIDTDENPYDFRKYFNKNLD